MEFEDQNGGKGRYSCDSLRAGPVRFCCEPVTSWSKNFPILAAIAVTATIQPNLLKRGRRFPPRWLLFETRTFRLLLPERFAAEHQRVRPGDADIGEHPIIHTGQLVAFARTADPEVDRVG